MAPPRRSAPRLREVQQAQEDEEQDAQQAPEEEQEEELAEVTRATEEPTKKETESFDQLLRAETRTSRSGYMRAKLRGTT